MKKRRSSLTMKKGQMEIIGLMIIVLLLIFALLIYFRFSSTDETSIISEAEQNLEVNNLLTAIKLYTVEDGQTVKDLIKNCVSGSSTDCDYVVVVVPEIVEAYGWSEDEYRFYVDGVLEPRDDCPSTAWVADFTVSGTEVRLAYCTD